MLHGPTLQGPRQHNPLLQGLWDTVLCLMVLRWRYRVLMVLCYTVFCITVLRYKVLRYTFLCNTVLYYTVHSPVCMVLCYTVIYSTTGTGPTLQGPMLRYMVLQYCMLYGPILHGPILHVCSIHCPILVLYCMVIYWKCYSIITEVTNYAAWSSTGSAIITEVTNLLTLTVCRMATRWTAGWPSAAWAWCPVPGATTATATTSAPRWTQVG